MSSLSKTHVGPGRKADFIRKELGLAANVWVSREVLRAAFLAKDAVTYLENWRDHYRQARICGAGVAAVCFDEAIVAVKKKGW